MTIAIPAPIPNYNVGLSLLEIVQTVCDEIGLPQPTSVISNPDQQIRQLLALANREGREQVSLAGGWPQLRGLQTITLVSGQSAYPFPSDFDSYMPTTIWNVDKRWPVQGPLTPQEWETLKSGYVNILPYQRYRVMQGQIYFDPTPDSTDGGQTLVIEYQSNGFCESEGGTPQNQWLSDTDVWRLPQDVIVLGLKWRFLAAKRMDYSEEKKAWADCVDREQARAYVGRTLPLNASDAGYGANFLGDGWSQTGDGNFPGR